MEIETGSPPKDNMLDLTDLELCEKCKCALLSKFLRMYNEAVIDKPWNKEDLDRFNNRSKTGD